MKRKRFNALGVREIDLADWHDEMVTHWATEQKGEPDAVYVEARVSLYDESGNCFTGVIECKLEKQTD